MDALVDALEQDPEKHVSALMGIGDRFSFGNVSAFVQLRKAGLPPASKCGRRFPGSCSS
jgi:hypothetical protein